MSHLLSVTGLEPKRCAELLGLSPRLYSDWSAGQKPLPASVSTRIAAILGVPEPEIVRAGDRRWKEAEEEPAVWYKLRSAGLEDSDKESVFLVRQLGLYVHQLEQVTDRRTIGWNTLFEEIRRNTDTQAPPRRQGRQAAHLFRESRGLSHGKTAIGEVVRENLRTLGILVIETRLADSKVEGCAFFVGLQEHARPCIVANSHHSTWFRRNAVLMHELAHLIFDARSLGATFDLYEDARSEFCEERAEAFAQEVLIPQDALRHMAQGFDWSNISPVSLAQLVARTAVEQKLLARAAVDAGFIATSAEVTDIDIAAELRKVSDHALTTAEYIRKVGAKSAEDWLEKRNTTLPGRAMLLPVHYVRAVVEAQEGMLVSPARAAELLMIGEDEYRQRFDVGHLEEDDE